MKYKEIRTLTAYNLRECYGIGGIAWEVNRACNVRFMEQ